MNKSVMKWSDWFFLVLVTYVINMAIIFMPGSTSATIVLNIFLLIAELYCVYRMVKSL